MNFPECNRCKRQKPEHVVICLNPNPLLGFGNPDGRTLAEPLPLPAYETICYECLTPSEVARMLQGVVVACLEHIQIEKKARQDLGLLYAMRHVRTRLSFELGSYRDYRDLMMIALRAIALPIDQIRGYHRCIQCAALRHESELYHAPETSDWACVDPKHGRL